MRVDYASSGLLGIRKACLILLNFAVASYNVLDGAVAEFVVDDFGQNCVELIKNKILELK